MTECLGHDGIYVQDCPLCPDTMKALKELKAELEKRNLRTETSYEVIIDKKVWNQIWKKRGL